MADGADDRPGPVEPDAVADAAPIVISVDPRSAVWVSVGLLLLGFVFAIVRTSVQAFTLIGVGVLLAFALEPLVKGVKQRLGCTRALAVAVVGLGAVVLFGALAFVMGPAAVQQAQRFGRELPQTVRDLYELPVVGPRLQKADAAPKVEEWAEGLPGRLDGRTVSRTARSVFDGITGGFTVVVVAIVVLLDGEVLVRRVRELVPVRYRDQADDVGRVFYRVVGTYFAGSLLVAIIGGLYVLAVGLALGVPLAPVAAVWYAVVSLIPQVGGFLGISFFTILALSQGPIVGLVGLVLLVLYMNVENYVISPAIVGQSVNLSPPTTMIAALIGGAAAGVPGALAATPLCGTVKALYMEYRFGQEIDYTRHSKGLLQRIKVPGFVRGRRRGGGGGDPLSS